MRKWMILLLMIQSSFADVSPVMKQDFVIGDSADSDFSLFARPNADSTSVFVKMQSQQQTRSDILSTNTIQVYTNGTDSIAARFGRFYGNGRFSLHGNFSGKFSGKKQRVEVSISKDTTFDLNGVMVSVASKNWADFSAKLNPMADIELYSAQNGLNARQKCDSFQYVMADSARAEIIGEMRWFEVGKKQLSAMYRFPFMKASVSCEAAQADDNVLASDVDPNDMADIFASLSKPKREISLYDEGDTAGFDLSARIVSLPATNPTLNISGVVFVNELMFSVAKELSLTQNKRICESFRFGKLCWDIRRTKKFKR